MDKMDEIIVVIPRSSLFGDADDLSFQGGMFGESKVLQVLRSCIEEKVELKRRGNMEKDPTYKQLIPYAYISVAKTETEDQKFFVYERLTGAGEARLHNKLSLGVGGHMNKLDGFQDIFNEVGRELLEEVEVSVDGTVLGLSDLNFSIEGMINDDSNEVGEVHLGIAIKMEAPGSAKVEVQETEELAGQLLTLDQMLEPSVYERLENWSKIVVDHLKDLRG